MTQSSGEVFDARQSFTAVPPELKFFPIYLNWEIIYRFSQTLKRSSCQFAFQPFTLIKNCNKTLQHWLSEFLQGRIQIGRKIL